MSAVIDLAEWINAPISDNVPAMLDPESKRIRIKAAQIFASSRTMAYQRAIREAYTSLIGGTPYANLHGATVRAISKTEAEKIILRYEWLGTFGRSRAFYGLFIGDDLIGCVCFGLPTGAQSRDICGVENRDKAICLMRGACTHLAPKNAASFLISESCRLANTEHGWGIFYAYADAEAGEIGNVYQAANWRYIGQGVGRTPGRLREEWILPDGKQVSNRYLRHRGLKIKGAIALGWRRVFTLPKHKYVWFEGTRRERRTLVRACRYPFLPYPKERNRPLAAPLLEAM